jgi:5-methylcytosine-specific restriction endonuclease McrA
MKVRCAACRQYKEKEYCVPYGLGWCCDANCRWEAVQRRRRSSAPRDNARPKTPRTHQPNRDKRKAIQIRDGNRCRFCLTPKNLHVHHIIYRSQRGSNDERNLVTLCLGHHDTVHSSKRRWQPVLLELIRLHYDEGLYLTVGEVERRMLAEAS